MQRATRVRRGPRAALALAAGGLLALATLTGVGSSASAATGGGSDLTCASQGGTTRVGHLAGVARAVPGHARCTSNFSDAAIGTPPLLFHGGPVMGTRSTGAVVVTPIYWNPAGHPISNTYKTILNTYVRDVAADSGTHTNVFSTLTEYFGTNGAIRYQVTAGSVIDDTAALPANGCKVNGQDTSRIYADGTGYDSCIDDDQLTAEIDRVVTANHLTRDLAHIYVMFLPKHLESCFFAGSTTTASNFCTINHQPSAAYCAYHSQVTSTGTVYANMPFPIYNSAAGFTCSTEKDFGTVQTPNGDPDADTEVSPTSHEIMEAVTDPDTSTGWYDSSGFENGDECAYVFGTVQGTAGALYNQVINRHHYLTQEEFSNKDFARTGKGCLPGE